MVSILPPLHQFKGLIKGKDLPRYGRKRTLSDFITFFYLLVFICCITCVFCFYYWVSLVLCFVLFNMFLFVYFQFFVYFVFDIKKIEKSEKYKNSVCSVYIGTCVPWMAIEIKFSKFCISCRLDEHLYAQLSKWTLWLLFVMSKIELSLILNTHITFFDGRTKKSWEKDINNHLTIVRVIGCTLKVIVPIKQLWLCVS